METCATYNSGGHNDEVIIHGAGDVGDIDMDDSPELACAAQRLRLQAGASGLQALAYSKFGGRGTIVLPPAASMSTDVLSSFKSQARHWFSVVRLSWSFVIVRVLLPVLPISGRISGSLSLISIPH
jgi:hypothetical protein